jgi:hypothetical protein
LSVQIVEAGGDYIWLAKDNQLHLREAIAQLFVPQTPRTSLYHAQRWHPAYGGRLWPH